MKVTTIQTEVTTNYNLVDFKIDVSNEETVARLFSSLIFIYKDSFAFVREVVQNSYDAIVELWELKYKSSISLDDFLIKHPIIFKLNDIDDTYYVEISESHGIGISPERISKIFEFVSKSTKRSSDSQIGEKGIGKLSPLAYNNMYFINTIYDGIMYEYKVAWLDKNKPPTISLLYSTKTNNLSGTTVRIPLKYKEDIVYLNNAIFKYLIYFNNIYYVNIDKTEWYPSQAIYMKTMTPNVWTRKVSINLNNQPIHNFKTFIRREGVSPNLNNDGVFTEMHLCIDRIPYRINWSLLDISPIYIPIGIKISSSEVLLNDNRDDIRYLDNDAINKIKEKIVAAANEIVSLYNNKEYFNVTDDFYTFIKNYDNYGKFKIGKDTFLIEHNPYYFFTPFRHLLPSISYNKVLEIFSNNHMFTPSFIDPSHYISKSHKTRLHPLKSKITIIDVISGTSNSYFRLLGMRANTLIKNSIILINDVSDFKSKQIDKDSDYILLNLDFNKLFLNIFSDPDYVKSYITDWFNNKYEKLSSHLVLNIKKNSLKKDTNYRTVYCLNSLSVKQESTLMTLEQLQNYVLFKETDYNIAKYFNSFIKRFDKTVALASNTTYDVFHSVSIESFIKSPLFYKMVTFYRILMNDDMRIFLLLHYDYDGRHTSQIMNNCDLYETSSIYDIVLKIQSFIYNEVNELRTNPFHTFLNLMKINVKHYDYLGIYEEFERMLEPIKKVQPLLNILDYSKLNRLTKTSFKTVIKKIMDHE